jgi:HEAT repeat protein
LSIIEQHGLLTLVQNCLPLDEEVLETMARILPQASLVLRRRIVTSICQMSGVRANQLVAELIARETDGEILMALIPELRRRNLTRAMKTLLNLLDHGHSGVQRKAAEAFHDCTIQRYLAAYGLLNDAVRRSTGQLVHKVDPSTNRVLADELASGNRIRQTRALQAIRSIGNVDEVCSLVMTIAQNPDPRLKVVAIGTLAAATLPEARGLIRRFLVDANPAIRRAAELSLDVTADK